MTDNRKIIGLVLLIAGVVFGLEYYGISMFSYEEIIGYCFIFYGVTTVYVSLTNGERNFLVIGAASFMVGIIITVITNYEIINTRGIILSSILFINGTAFFLLFIDNTKQKVFLYAAVALFISGYFSITVLKSIIISALNSRFIKYAEDFLPLFLVLAGLVVILKRKDKLLS